MVFRYPGAKTKLFNQILPLIESDLSKSRRFVDVFVGGGSVSIAIAQKYPDLPILANDGDPTIASYWQLVATGSDEQWADLFALVDQKPTVELFNLLRSKVPSTLVERAYYAIFFNRCTFSGIATAGPIGGQLQKSKWTVDCRYNAKRIKQSCETLRRLFRQRATVENLLFPKLLQQTQPTDFLYLDPPYYHQGKNLYPTFMLPAEHVELAQVLKAKRNWALSYDNCPEVRELYESWAEVLEIPVRYSIDGEKSNWKNKTEFLILAK